MIYDCFVSVGVVLVNFDTDFASTICLHLLKVLSVFRYNLEEAVSLIVSVANCSILFPF